LLCLYTKQYYNDIQCVNTKITNVHYVCVKKRWHKCSDMWVGTQFILCNNYFELLFRSEQATENYIQK
jgi:hypothetical protein